MTAFHRNPNNPAAAFGKSTEQLKTLVPEEVKQDFERMARENGYASASELLREMVLVATYGADMVRSLYERRLAVLETIGTEKAQG